MKCARCSHEMEGKLLFCPRCGLSTSEMEYKEGNQAKLPLGGIEKANENEVTQDFTKSIVNKSHCEFSICNEETEQLTLEEDVMKNKRQSTKSRMKSIVIGSMILILCLTILGSGIFVYVSHKKKTTPVLTGEHATPKNLMEAYFQYMSNMDNEKLLNLMVDSSTHKPLSEEVKKEILISTEPRTNGNLEAYKRFYGGKIIDLYYSDKEIYKDSVMVILRDEQTQSDRGEWVPICKVGDKYYIPIPK